MAHEEFQLMYTAVDTEQCVGVKLKRGNTICHGWLLDIDDSETSQVICDVTHCPLLAKIAIEGAFND